MNAASAHACTHTHTTHSPRKGTGHHCPHLVAAAAPPPLLPGDGLLHTAVQCCIAAMQCDADMQVLKIGPLSLFENDPGPRTKHCFYRPHGPTSNCPAPAVPSLRRQLAADRRWRWSLDHMFG